MKLSRIRLFVVAFIILLLPFILYRVIWLRRSLPAKGVVLYIEQTIFTWPTQYYPVIQFKTEQYVVKVTGHYNAPYEVGDSVEIRYIPNHPTNYKVDKFWEYWYASFIWAGLLLLLGTFLLVRDIVPNKTFLVNGRGLTQVD